MKIYTEKVFTAECERCGYTMQVHSGPAEDVTKAAAEKNARAYGFRTKRGETLCDQCMKGEAIK